MKMMKFKKLDRKLKGKVEEVQGRGKSEKLEIEIRKDKK